MDDKLKEMNALIKDLKNWRDLDEHEIEKKIERFEQIPRDEWSKYRTEALSEASLGEELKLIAKTYHKNSKILRNVVSSLGNQIERYNLSPSDSIYEFFLENRNHKGVNFYIVLFLTTFPQFEEYPGKWDFIMSIPKIAPQKKTREIFYKEIKNRRINELPNEYKVDVVQFFKSCIANNETIGEYTKNKYEGLINMLEKD